MANDCHQSVVIIKYAFVVNLLGVPLFPRDSVVATFHPKAHVGDLGFFVERKDTVENGVRERKLLRFPIGEDSLDLAVEVEPFLFAPEVVNHHESAT